MFRSKKLLISIGIIALLEIAIFTGMSLREAIGMNFLLASLAVIIFWFVGMFKPTIVRWGNRKTITKYSAVMFILFFILFVIAIPKASPLEQAANKTDDHTEVLGTNVLTSETTQKNSELASLSLNTTTIEAKVTAVTDGDTFTVQLDGKSEKVRLILIDTPETKPVQPFGPEASAFTTKLLKDHTVRLEFDVSERDQYGRILAYAYVDDKMVNELLLEKGLARVAVFQPNVKNVDQFRSIEKKLKQQN